MKTAGAILAAGRGRRMGGPKALLAPAGRTLLEIAVATLRGAGVDDLVAVLPPGLAPPSALAADARLRFAVNEDEASGPIGSLAAALAAGAADADRVVAHLVDIPGTAPATIRALLEAPAPAGTLFVVPVFDDGPGHPVVVLRPAYPLIRPGVAGGLKTLLRAHAAHAVNVRLAGPKPRDIDTPADLSPPPPSS